MPESLLINGHRPISLLPAALSEGVHAFTDERCLELAGSVRVVLGERSDRLSQALKDKAELTKALSALMNRYQTCRILQNGEGAEETKLVLQQIGK